MTNSNEETDGSKHGAWTAQEDQLLGKYQEVHGNRWSLVAMHIPGRTGQQCAQRWRHKVNPNIRKEKWTASEDRQLASLVAEHGNRWADIARQMPGRTDQQCMGRWRRHLDPNIRKCHWQAQEDELLKQQYETLGPQWSNISKSLLGRTAQQCRARWFQLCPSSNAPPVPRTARNQNGRRDRHYDGASIQESARMLVAQMSTVAKSGVTAVTQSMEKDTSNTESQAGFHKGGESAKAASVSRSAAETQAPAPEACAVVSARRQRRLHACMSPAVPAKEEIRGGAPVVADGASLKERRAAARHRNMMRRQAPLPDRDKASPERAVAGADAEGCSALAWESKRRRSRSTRPRRNVGLVAIRSASPSGHQQDDDEDCETPRGDDDRVLEAAAALTEMAGGPRVNPSASPPSVRAAAARLLQPELPPEEERASLMPPKDELCCTPAKRPAILPLWDGGSPAKLSRCEQSELEQSPSHARIHTPLLQFGASPWNAASPLHLHHEPTVVMTPGSQTLLRSMAHNPIDKLDIAGDFSTPLSTPGQSQKKNWLTGEGAQTPSVLRWHDRDAAQTAVPSRVSMAMPMQALAPPPTQRSLVFNVPLNEAVENGQAADTMEEPGSRISGCQFMSPVKGERTAGANEGPEEAAVGLSALHSTPPSSVLRPQTPCKHRKVGGMGLGPARVMPISRGLAVKVDQDADMPELGFGGPHLGVQALTPFNNSSSHLTAQTKQDENDHACDAPAGTASNSSTGKSSGVSSLDAVDRTASRQNGAELEPTRGVGGQQGDGGGCDPGGSRGIRTQLDSLLNDVFSF